MPKVNPGKKIRKALENQGMTWTALLEETKLSRGALSKHLNSLIRRKIVLTRTQDTRPPRTMYYLAKQPIMNLLLFLTEGRSQEEIDDLFENILTENVWSILIEAHNRIFDSGAYVKIPLDESIVRYDALKEKERRMRFDLAALLEDVDLANMTEEEREAFKGKHFSHISVQFILAVSTMERKLLDLLPKEPEDFKRFMISALIQEENAQNEFENFSKWWQKTIAPKIPSTYLLLVLALHFVTIRLSKTYSTSYNISSQQPA
jgi:DNA-binding transcriptional ArsR family regulator